jgi:hypothetical protein
MSYYDDPATYIHARIASEKSQIVNLRYSHNRIISTLTSTPLEEISEELIQRQIQIIRDLQQTRLNILMLESELTAFTVPTVVSVEEPSNTVVDTSISGELVNDTVDTNVVDDNQYISSSTVINTTDTSGVNEYISSSTVMDSTEVTE